jgi:hypothetical protein
LAKSNATCSRAASLRRCLISRGRSAATSLGTTMTRSRFAGHTRTRRIELLLIQVLQSTSPGNPGTQLNRRWAKPCVGARSGCRPREKAVGIRAQGPPTPHATGVGARVHAAVDGHRSADRAPEPGFAPAFVQPRLGIATRGLAGKQGSSLRVGAGPAVPAGLASRTGGLPCRCSPICARRFAPPTRCSIRTSSGASPLSAKGADRRARLHSLFHRRSSRIL